MIRCKPLLGTYVEISIQELDNSINDRKLNHAFNEAFVAIELVQELMSFHNPESELSYINSYAHIQTISVHPWTFDVLRAAKELHETSGGVFDCAVGAKLVQAGLLPQHQVDMSAEQGSLGDLVLVEPNQVRSHKSLQLDLGGIAKGFAVDKAVEVLETCGIRSGCVNAGGDLRVFGTSSQEIQVRNPHQPTELINIASLENGAIASSGLYYSENVDRGHIINPLTMEHVQFQESYSMIAPQCIFADALTKVLAITKNPMHPCFSKYSAQAIGLGL
jgi:thiamine biosynthesis lipoprotein